MKVGAHVLIIGDHPHAGKTGKITAPVMWDIAYDHGIKQPLYDFVVRLDKVCLDCACKNDQIEKVKR